MTLAERPAPLALEPESGSRYVRRVIGDLVVSEAVGSEDAVQVRSAATWKVIATVKGLADGAYAGRD